MSDKIIPGPVSDERSIREAVCIHTKKIFDSCKSKDCIEDLRVYPTRASQEILDRAMSVKARSAELLCAYIDVQPVNFNRGFFSVDVRYFYRITADAFIGATRPLEICGLAVFDKRSILFGSESCSKVFSSSENHGFTCPCVQTMPTAELEAVDPIILGLKLVNVCDCRPCDCSITEIPMCITEAFGDDLIQSGDERRLFISLGQFSILRLERDTHLLMPVYDYCMPDKECTCGEECAPEDPCEVFRKVKFPVSQFFPPNSAGPRDSCNCSGCNF